MADTPQHLAQRLAQEGEKVSAFFRGLSPQHWEMQIYTEGACWTARQVLAHFDITEINIDRLIEDILKGGSGAPEDFDINRFNERKVSALAGVPPEELLRRFHAHRQATVELVGGLTGEDLSRTGRHPYLGITALVDIIKLMYIHNQTHIREIRRILV